MNAWLRRGLLVTLAFSMFLPNTAGAITCGSHHQECLLTAVIEGAGSKEPYFANYGSLVGAKFIPGQAPEQVNEQFLIWGYASEVNDPPITDPFVVRRGTAQMKVGQNPTTSPPSGCTGACPSYLEANLTAELSQYQNGDAVWRFTSADPGVDIDIEYRFDASFGNLTGNWFGSFVYAKSLGV